MSDTATEILERAATSSKDCTDCANTRWKYLEPGDDAVDFKSPCPTCKPYGSRVKAESVHRRGQRVQHIYSQRTGVVMRAWRRSQGKGRSEPFVMVDIRYDDELPGVAWEKDLAPYKDEADARDMGPVECDERGEPFPF